MGTVTKPEQPTDWNDEAQVRAFYDAQNAYYAAERKRKDREADKRWTYAGLDAWLTGRNKDSRKLARNTYLKRRHDCIAVKYHQTDVVRYYPNGEIVLDSAGWKTMTTKERIDWFTPRWLRIYSERGVWYVLVRNMKASGHWEGKRYRFFDGVKFGPRGGCRNPMPQSVQDREDEFNRNMDERIREYVAGWIGVAVSGQMELPSGGDCWHCCMFPESDHEGESHLLEHLDEQYYVPSLIVKAIKAKGYNNPAVTLLYMYGMQANEARTHFDGTAVHVKDVRKLLTWYLRKHLRRNMAPPR